MVVSMRSAVMPAAVPAVRTALVAPMTPTRSAVMPPSPSAPAPAPAMPATGFQQDRREQEQDAQGCGKEKD